MHQSVPEAKTRQEAELAERQIIKASFDHNYNVTDTTTTLASFIEKKYRPYVQQNNVNKGAKDLYIRLLLGHFKKQTLASISPQDCRNCRSKLQTRQNKRKKESAFTCIDQSHNVYAFKDLQLGMRRGNSGTQPDAVCKGSALAPTAKTAVKRETKRGPLDGIEKRYAPLSTDSPCS